MPDLRRYLLGCSASAPGTLPAKFSLVLLLAFTCYGCTLPASAQNQLELIEIQPAGGLPPDFVSDIDVLFIYDSDLLNQLPFTQFEWISSKQDYLDRQDNLLEMVQVQITASSAAQEIALPARAREAVGILVFASHEDPVAEALDISNETRIVLQIESYGINVL